MSDELNCKWHFAEMSHTSGDEGPNSAMSQTFSEFPCKSLVRESIQNSLDAVLNKEKPVVVCFEHRTFEKDQYKNFFKITEHISACQEYYSTNKVANIVYPEMRDYLDDADELGFIRVADYNTKGMDYEEGSTDKTFYAFVRAAGVSVKQAEGAGGSFGFGKGALFVMSPINTLLVSTCNKDNAHHFEGVTRLCTHEIGGKKLSHMGFYDNNDGNPTHDCDLIPQIFRRSEPGTSIGIMGVDRIKWNDSIKDNLAKEVLSNFFVAILRDKLVVYIDGNPNSSNRNDIIVINSDTIGNLMSKYFVDTKDSNRQDSFNPRPYYEAMTDVGAMHYEQDLPSIGHVELFLKEFSENRTQIIYMRKLLMKVYRDPSRTYGNCNGVFICEDEKGNRILGDMEDPEHKSWKPVVCRKNEVETEYNLAKKAAKEIKDFVTYCLDDFLDLGRQESVEICGIEKYLPSIANEKGKGEKGNPFIGRPTGKYVKDGSSLNTEGTIKHPESPSQNRIGNVIEVERGSIKSDPTAKETGGIGGSNKGKGGNATGAGDRFITGVVEDGAGHFKRIIDVDWRPIQSVKKGFIDVVIYPPKDILSAELNFQIGSESSRNKKEDEEDIYIVSCNKGSAKGLKITDVPLMVNKKNVIQILFSDHTIHSLILTVYEAN